jgi:hypothetical protein
MRASPLSRTGRLLLYTLVCICGVGMVFYPTLSSGFESMQVEPGDTLLNHYFLEHLFQWVTNREYIGELWSPPFMYPYQEALAFSDNLFAAGPFYWVFRAFVSPDIAYQLWMMAMFVLDFACFCWLGRKVGANPLISAAAAFVFAFGMPRAAQLGHQQLLPQFYTPLALVWFWELLRTPSLKALSLALLFTYLQLMAGIYLGWFLLFSLAFFIPILMLLNADSFAKITRLLRSAPQAWAIVMAWAVATVVSMLPYLRAQAEVGRRNFSEIDTMLPRVSSWFLPYPGSIYGALLRPDADLPMVHEHWMFAGFGVWLMLALAAWALALNLLSDDLKRLAYASGLTAAAIVLCSLRWPGGFTAWVPIFDYIPGAGAIRGVSRIWLIVYPYALLAGLIGSQAFIKSRLASPARGSLVAALLLVFCMGEQVLANAPSFKKRPFSDDVADIQSLIRNDCDFVYLTHPSMPTGVVALKAMWAGMQTNVPVVNGYSGNYPKNYPYPAERVNDIVGWLNRTDPNLRGDLCVILPAQIKYSAEYRRGSESPLKKWQSFYVALE